MAQPQQLRVALLLGALLACASCERTALPSPIAQRLTTLQMPRDARLLAAHGDCAPDGYGYVKRVLGHFPDAATRPTIRYKTFDRHVENALTPFRPLANPNVLVGVDLAPPDLEEQVLTARPDAAGTWQFTTEIDFEQLTAVVLQPAPQTPVTVTLYDGPGHARVLWHQTLAPSTPGTEARIDVVPPVQPFSFGRGGAPFALAVSPSGAIQGVQVRVRRVDLSDFRILQRQGACFTAVRRSWEAGLSPSARAAWQPLLSWGAP